MSEREPENREDRLERVEEESVGGFAPSPPDDEKD
jgi:hypothetical protein